MARSVLRSYLGIEAFTVGAFGFRQCGLRQPEDGGRADHQGLRSPEARSVPRPVFPVRT